MHNFDTSVLSDFRVGGSDEQSLFVLNHLPVGLIFRHGGIIRYCNSIISEMTGYPVEELLERSVDWLFSPEQLRLIRERDRAVIEDRENQPPLRLDFVHRDGHKFPIESTSVYTVYRGKPYILSMIQDLSRQVTAEERIRKRELQLNMTLMATDTGLWEYFPEREALHCISIAKVVMSNVPDLVYIPLITWLDLVHPDDKKAFMQKMTLMNSREETAVKLEWRNRGEGEDWLWMGASFLSISPADGKDERHWLGIIQNIDDRKRRELDLRVRESLLERTERMAALGGLTSAMAHEIRQPLNLIKILSDTLSYSLDLPPDKQYDRKVFKQKLSDISSGVDRINRTIGNLKALFSISGQVEREPTDLNSVIGLTLSFYEKRLKSRGIELFLHLDEGIPSLFVSPIQIQEILTNLVNNGIDAMEDFTPPPGEGKEISISTGLGQSRITLSYEDNGPGISPEHMGSLFDPYFSTKKGHGGMGMGLYLVHRMMEEMGGSIGAEENARRGARFLMEFPL